MGYSENHKKNAKPGKKERLEKLIDESPLFSLDKETEYTLYKREYYKLLEHIYSLLMLENKGENEPYGCEIVDVATKCINYYNPETGPFTYYFRRSWRRKRKALFGDESIDDNLKGMHISSRDRNDIRKYFVLANKLTADKPYAYNSQALYQKIADAMGIPVKKVMELAKLSEFDVRYDMNENEEGEAFNLSDKVQATKFFESSDKDRSETQPVLRRIESAYCSLQDRQKQIISDLITAKICSLLEDEDLKLPFVSEQIMEEWKQTGTVPTQKEIAERYGRKEASVSRTLKEFLRKVEKETE